MKVNDYQNAIRRFEPDPALKGRIAEAVLSDASPAHDHRFTRMAVGAIAAVLLIACSAGAVMAASPEFRAAVLNFLHIGETEDVPGPNASLNGEPDVSGTVIGETVKAQYIQMNGNFNVARDGLLCETRVDPDTEAVMPVSFWNIEGNTAVSAGVKVNKSEISVDMDGTGFNGIFYWYEHDGELNAFKPSRNLAPGENRDVNASVINIRDKTDTVVVELALDGRCEYFYYDLNAGITKGLFEGTDAEDMDDLKKADLAPDMSSALLERNDGWSYLDLKTGKVSTLSELAGVSGFNMACFLNDGSIQLLKWIDVERLGAGNVDCWLYDPADGSTTKVLNGERVYNEFNEPDPCGVVILGRYCLDVDETGRVKVIDLKAGTSIPVDGFVYDPEATMRVSPDGTKILYAKFDDSGMMFVTCLGVIDLVEGTVIEFDRAKQAEMFELKCYWLDNDRVAISGVAFDDKVTSLYIYKF